MAVQQGILPARPTNQLKDDERNAERLFVNITAELGILLTRADSTWRPHPVFRSTVQTLKSDWDACHNVSRCSSPPSDIKSTKPLSLAFSAKPMGLSGGRG